MSKRSTLLGLMSHIFIPFLHSTLSPQHQCFVGIWGLCLAFFTSLEFFFLSFFNWFHREINSCQSKKHVICPYGPIMRKCQLNMSGNPAFKCHAAQRITTENLQLISLECLILPLPFWVGFLFKWLINSKFLNSKLHLVCSGIMTNLHFL